MLGVGGGVVFQALAPGDRQTAGWAGLARQQVGRGPTALIARPPHLQNRLHLADPGQGHGLAGVQHHDGVRIHRCNFLHQLVLIAGQAEDRRQARPHKDHRHLGALRGGDGGLVVGLALFGGIPVEPHLDGRVGAVRAGLISIACGPAVNSTARRTLSRPSVVGTTLSWLACRMSPCTPPWYAPVAASRLPSREILALVPIACR
jgi:hypothetical protein